VATGDVDIRRLINATHDYFAALHSECDGSQVVDTGDTGLTPSGFTIRSKQQDVDNPYLAVVLPELNDAHPDNETLNLLTRVFASGKQSRLYKRLVIKDKTCFNVRLSSLSGRLPGITILQFDLISQAVMADVLYAVYDEWLHLCECGLQAEEINKGYLDLRNAWLFDFDNNENYASALAEEELRKSYLDLYDYPLRLSTITAESLRRVIKDYYSPEHLAIYHIGAQAIPSQLKINLLRLFNQHSSFKLTNSEFSLAYPEDIRLQPDFATMSFTDTANSPKQEDTFQSCVLDCGLRLTMLKKNAAPFIGLALGTALSQLTDPQDLLGLNYFTASTMLYGTHKRSFDDLHAFFQDTCSELKVDFAIDSTIFKARCYPAYLPELLSLLQEILCQPSFPRSYLNLIKQKVKGALRQEKENPFYHALEQWMALLLGKDTNLHRPYGNSQQIQAIKLEEIQKHHRELFHPANYTLCLIGDLDFTRTAEQCNALFNVPYAAPNLPTATYCYQPSSQKTRSTRTKMEQANIMLGGFAAHGADKSAQAAFQVLSQALGGDLNSRLYQQIRERKGLAYQVGFDYTAAQKLGYWLAYASCSRADATVCSQLLYDTLEAVFQDGITAEELAAAKSALLGMHLLDAEDLVWQATSLASELVIGNSVTDWLAWENHIRQVTLEDIRHICNTWLKPDTYYHFREK